MPRRDRAAYMREYRRRKKAERAPKRLRQQKIPDSPEEQAELVCNWAAKRLVVPPGHKNAGQAMVVPDYGRRWLSDALGHRESLICLARKNSKSAVAAILALAHLVGPLRRRGWRGAVASLSRSKAAELAMQAEQIAEASRLCGLTFRKAPLHILGTDTRLDVLSADKNSGAASGYDLIMADELGLFPPNARELMAGLRSSLSARDGKLLALSVRGHSELLQEILDRNHLDDTSIHFYAADPDCDISDVEQWHKANPGLAVGIKSVSYMQSEAKRVLATPGDMAHFRCFDLNEQLDPSRSMIVSVSDWQACTTDKLPSRQGEIVIGIDLGGSSSMTALVAIWIRTGRMEAWGAYGDNPDLKSRGTVDGCGSRYLQMAERGELLLFPGRTTPCIAFLRDIFQNHLRGCHVIALAADRHRKSDLYDAIDQSGIRVDNVELRGMGASATAHGSADVRALQKLVYDKWLQIRPSLLMVSGIKEAHVDYDRLGNPFIEKSRSKGRIDALSAGVLAAGLAMRHRHKPKKKKPRLHIVKAA